MSIADNWRGVLDRVSSAGVRTRWSLLPSPCKSSQFPKHKSPADIRAAYEAGARAFGENYAQELRDKAETLADLRGVRWHFIGPAANQQGQVRGQERARVSMRWTVLDVAQELSQRGERMGPLRCYLGGECGG